jgi:Domain of Unknown Function (DUF1080)
MRILLAIVGVAQIGAAQDQGWHPLFDGQTSKGWVDVTGKPFPTHSWAIEDGCLKALVRKDGEEDIRTAETFTSFELQWEWKLTKLGNSGVKYLIQRYDDWSNKEGRRQGPYTHHRIPLFDPRALQRQLENRRVQRIQAHRQRHSRRALAQWPTRAEL